MNSLILLVNIKYVNPRIKCILSATDMNKHLVRIEEGKYIVFNKEKIQRQRKP